MRTLDPILEDALANQKGELILRVLTWTDQAAYLAAPAVPEHTWVVENFNIQSTSADAVLITENNYVASTFSVFIIERGVKLSGVEYPVQSGLFFVRSYKEDFGRIRISGSSYPKLKISIPGDDTYENVITAFCTAIGKTAVFKNATDAWLNYQFLPAGKTLSLNKAELFESLLKQKYCILVYEESPGNLVFYNQDSYPSSALKAIADDGTKLTAIATAGTTGAMTSPNGADWTPQTTPAFANDVCYSPALALWVAVGVNVCHTSPDGITWTARTIPAGTYNSVAWSAVLALFVAVGNVCATSPDGVTWTARTNPIGTYYNIYWSTTDSLFIAIGAAKYATSTDGLSWTYGNLATSWNTGTVLPTTISAHTSCILSDGRILITGGVIDGAAVKSTYFGTIFNNVITWSAGADLPVELQEHTCNVLTDGRILITGGFDSAAKTKKTYFGTISNNVITWVAGTDLPTTIYGHCANILSDGRILITGGFNVTFTNETQFGVIAGNTITWSAGTNLSIARSQHTCTLLSDGRILIAGGNISGASNKSYFGTISINTITWANGTDLPTALNYHTANLLANDTLLLIGGSTGPGYGIVRIGTISVNTISWSTNADLQEIYSHTCNIATDGRIIVTGGSGPLGDIDTVSLSDKYNHVTKSNNIYIAVGMGVCQSSPDTTAWTARTIPAGTYNAVCWSSDLTLFVAVGDGVVAASANGIDWDDQTPAELNNWQAVIWSPTLALFIAVASDGASRTMTSPNGIAWTASTANADLELDYEDGPTSYLIRDQSRVHFLWRDEAATLHTEGVLTDPQWNLGYLESTDDPPTTHEDAYYKIFLQKAPVRLDITDGDKIHFTPYWSIDPTKTIDAMMQVSEHLDLKKSPAWYQEIKSIVMFNSTEGGALPSTIERVAAYTPLVSTSFDGNLTPAVNNLQAFAQAVDDLDLTGGAGAIPISTAANDFQVGSGIGTWVKQTLAQTITILRTSLDGIYAAIAHTHATYLLLSQASPQTITSGVPLMTTAVNGAGSANQLVNKAYVDLAVASLHVTEHLSAVDLSPDVGTFLKMTNTVAAAGTVQSVDITGTIGSPTAIFKWLTPAGEPHLDRIPAGTFDIHTHLLKTTTAPNNKIVAIYAEIWQNDAAGAHTAKIATSSTYQEFTTYNTFYDIYATVGTEFPLAVTDRISIEFFGYVISGLGENKLTMTVGGASDSHMDIDISSAELENIFVVKTRTITATAPITIAGTTSADLSANRTLAISAATASDPGSMSAADFKSLRDGWIPAVGTWTYASASTITAPSDARLTYQKGDKLRWKQGGAYKYGVISVVAETLLTIVVNTDYTVANSAITDAAWSFIENPIGWPDWFNWSPTFAGFSTPPTGTFIYKIFGKTCKCSVYMGTTVGTSNGDTFTMTAPVIATTIVYASCGRLFNNSIDDTAGASVYSYTADDKLYINRANGAAFTTSNYKNACFVIDFPF